MHGRQVGRRPWGIAIAVLVAAAVPVLIVLPSGGRWTGLPRRESNLYRPQSAPEFFWGGNENGPFSGKTLRQIARDDRIVVIAGFHGRYDLAVQETQARQLKTMNRSIKILFYFNAKYFLYEARQPRYLTGFDSASMALHDRDGRVIPFGVTSRQPLGIGSYVDETSAPWRQYFIRQARKMFSAAPFDGIAIDSMQPLSEQTDPVAIARLGAVRIARWNAGEVELLREVKATFPDKIVLYNGISPTIAGQANRDLAPLASANAVLNEGFCLENDVPAPKHIRQDIALMSTVAREHKMVLEKVNYGARVNERPCARSVGSRL